MQWGRIGPKGEQEGRIGIWSCPVVRVGWRLTAPREVEWGSGFRKDGRADGGAEIEDAKQHDGNNGDQFHVECMEASARDGFPGVVGATVHRAQYLETQETFRKPAFRAMAEICKVLSRERFLSR